MRFNAREETLEKTVKSDKNNVNSCLKLFRFRDLFVYIALIVIISALFLFGSSKNNDSIGFTVSYADKVILTYRYGDSSPVILSEYEDFIVFDKENNTITVFNINDKSHYNVISFNDKDFSVKISESNCSSTKECVNSPKIHNSGMIFCAPHDLRITPLSSAPTPPTVGG